MAKNDDLLNEINRYHDVAYAGYTLYRDDFHKLLDVYRGELPESVVKKLKKEGKSHISYKKARAIVDRYHAGVRSTYFTNDQFANIGSYDATEEAEKLARARQKAFDFHWKHTIKPYGPFNLCALDSGLYGTGVAKVYWDSQKDSPRIEHVNIHDVWFDPDAISVEDLRFVVHKYRKTKSDTLLLKKAGVFNGVFKDSDLTVTSEAGSGLAETTDHSRITLFDVYFKRNNDWFVTTMHNDNVLIRKDTKLNDGQPFIVGNILEQKWDDRERVVRIYGDTFLTSIDSLQMELTARVNQQLDAIALNNNPRYFTETSTGLDDSDLATGAGRQIVLTNMALKEMIPPPNIPILNHDIDRISRQMEESTGIKSLTGDSQTAMVNRQTAHGMEILSNESNIMPDSYIRSWNETFVEPLIERLVRLIWKHSKRSWLFEGVSRTMDDDFFVSVNAGLGATSKSIQIQGNDKLFQQFMAVQDVENARRIIKDTLPLYGKKNITKYFPTEEASKREREEAQAKMMQEEEEMRALQKAEVESRVQGNQAQTRMYIANAEEAEANKLTKLAKTEAEIKLMAQEIELKRLKIGHDIDKEIQEFDFKDREISIKELQAMRGGADDNKQAII